MAYINSKTYGNIVHKGDLYLTGVLRITSSTYLMRITSSGTSVLTPAGVVAGETTKKLKIAIDGVDYYLLAASDWVNVGSESRSPSASASPSRSPSASGSPTKSPSASRSPSASSSMSRSPSASSSPST